jgi:hypothetical protein
MKDVPNQIRAEILDRIGSRELDHQYTCYWRVGRLRFDARDQTTRDCITDVGMAVLEVVGELISDLVESFDEWRK